MLMLQRQGEGADILWRLFNGRRLLIWMFVGIGVLYSVAMVLTVGERIVQSDAANEPVLPEQALAEFEQNEDPDGVISNRVWYSEPTVGTNGTSSSNNTKSGGASGDDDPELFALPDVVLSSLTVFLGALICAGAGVGGGAFNLAAYILFLNMSTHSAVPLSKATILGVAIGGYMVTFSKRHPVVDRPLIDYETTLLMEPFALVGSVVGVFFNVAFPEYIILVCLVILLSVTAYKTFQKGWTTHKKERAAAQQPPKPVGPPADGEGYAYQPLSINDSENQIPQDVEARENSIGDPDINFGDIPLSLRAEGSKKEELPRIDNTEEELEKIVEHERRIPWLVLLALFLTWGCFVLAVIFAGFKGTSVIGISCGSPLFWVVLTLAAIFLTIITFCQAFRLSRIYHHKVAINYQFADGDLKWSGKIPYLFPFLCIIAGWTAGFLGVGGGLVQGPILLQMGMQPQVATITSSFMILFTSSSTTLQYALLGKIPWEFGLWYGCMAFLGAIIGQLALAEFIKRTGRASIAVLILAVMEVVSMLAIGGLGIKQIIAHEVSMDFEWICQ